MPQNKKSNITQEDVLQAVVVADRFDERFAPLTQDTPLALFPVANKPLISYTLDFLVSAGVQKIFVYCCNHFALIKDYLAKSKWNSRLLQCDIIPVVSADFTSLGDVLRDIDQKALFETDFLLVHGDLIANVSLEQAIAEHRARREKDKNKPLMTLLLRDCKPNHTTRAAEDDIFVTLDSKTQQVLHYQKVTSSGEKFDLPLRNFLQNSCLKFSMRYDLADAGISMCSPQVPQLFTDNFDYQTKEDFIRGILINEEFLGNQIHVHTVKGGHATRISSMHMYDMVSRAVICRWIYPYVPDNVFERAAKPWTNKEKNDDANPVNPYKHQRRNVYIGDIRAIGKNSFVENNSIIGHGSSIGDNCKILNSVIGCDTIIGNGVTIRDSYIWSNVTIKERCSIEKSVISNDVILYPDTILKPGCVLSAKVEIGPDCTLSAGTAIHIQPDEDTFAEGGEVGKKETNPSVVGIKGRGIIWSNVDADDSDEEVETVTEGIWGMSLTERDKNHPVVSEDDSSADEELSGESYEEGLMSDDEDNAVNLFFKEVKDSIARGVEENIKCDNLILEINSSKHAYNVTIQDIVKSVTRATLELADASRNHGAYFPALKKILTYLCPVFVNYNKTSQSQLDCLQEIEIYCLQSKHAFECLIKILMFLYDNDVLAEEVIMHWHKKPSVLDISQVADLTQEKLRNSVTKFIDWLQEAEEESSEEDDS